MVCSMQRSSLHKVLTTPRVLASDPCRNLLPAHPRYVDSFDVASPSGNQLSCLVMEKLGDSMSHVMSHFLGGVGVGLPLPVVQQLTRRVVRALDYLHRCEPGVGQAVSGNGLSTLVWGS